MFDFPEFDIGSPAPKTRNPDGKWDELDLELVELFEEFNAEAREINSRTKPVAEQLVGKQRELRAVSAQLNTLAEEKANIFKEITRIQNEARAAVMKLEERQKEIENQQFDLRRARTALQREIDQLKRKLQLEIDQIRKSLEYQENVKHYDVVTAGLKWREFAHGYQLTGAQIMANAARPHPAKLPGQGLILGDDMGLGKTLTSIITLDMLEAKRVLIVCPADQTTNFEREARTWAPHRAVASIYKMPEGVRSATLDIMKMQDHFTILVNYESWRMDDTLVDKLCEMGFDTIILDEAHNVKNTSTSAFKGVRRIVMAENCCPKCRSLDVYQVEYEKRRYRWTCKNCGWDATDMQYLAADRRSVRAVYPVTGTPILNKPQELFASLHLILPEVFEKETDFLRMYCEQNYAGYWSFKPGGLERLQSHLTGRYLARDRKTLEAEGITFPKQTVQIHDVDITEGAYPQQYKVIQQINKHAQILLESGKRMTMMNTLEIILRQRQANVWPGGIKLKDEDGNIVWSLDDEVKESIKLDWGFGLLDSFTLNGHRCVVFSQFKDPLHELARRLKENGVRAVVFDGSTPQHIREQVKIDFDRKYCEVDGYVPKWDVVLCNYKTGGVGLNFTAATRTIVTDEEWNPGKNSQAWRRTDRMGQTEENEVHIIRLNRTVDTWLANLINFKKGVVDGFNVSANEMQQAMLDGLQGGEFI